MAPVVVTWSDLAKHCPWSKGQPIGNGIYCAPWHSASSYHQSYADRADSLRCHADIMLV